VIWQLDLLLFAIVIVLAVLALSVRSLLAAVPILSAFSLVVAVMFAGLAAVDVAFVEAVLGAGLSGLLFLLLIRSTGDRLDSARPARGRLAVAGLVAVFVVLMVIAGIGLPPRGEPKAPAQERVAREYLERSVPETRTPNVVTAVLADFRSQDTLAELVVIFTAGTAVVMILAPRGRRRRTAPEGTGPDVTAPEESS
jgi:multicomponent Na+:H+ antiporter subunit B